MVGGGARNNEAVAKEGEGEGTGRQMGIKNKIFPSHTMQGAGGPFSSVGCLNIHK
jgi:hypothetical protein